MKTLKYRHETKHIISYSDYLAIRSRLVAVAMPDNNVLSNGTYEIRSLYFDNYKDRALKEKIDGINERKKFRIRCYNQDFSVIHLEKKSKRNGLCNKQSAALTIEQTKAILNGDIEFLKEQNNALMVELYAQMKGELLKPKVIVDYIREPYIYQPGNVRITFDTKIRSGLYNQDFFDPNPKTLEAQLEEGILMEVKYDEFLPELISLCIQVNERRGQAFSKYAACRRYG